MEDGKQVDAWEHLKSLAMAVNAWRSSHMVSREKNTHHRKHETAISTKVTRESGIQTSIKGRDEVGVQFFALNAHDCDGNALPSIA